MRKLLKILVLASVVTSCYCCPCQDKVKTEKPEEVEEIIEG